MTARPLFATPACLLALALGSISWAPAPQPAARPARPATAATTATTATAQDTRTSADEKQLCKAFRESYRGGRPEVRSEAVVTLDQASRELPDGGRGRLVARTLANALDDDELAVRTPAVRALAWGRRVEVVVEVLPELMDDLRNEIEKLSTRPDQKSRDRLRDVVTLYVETATALGRHADDRVVDYLKGELRNLRPSNDTRVVSLMLVEPLADALLALGSLDAVAITVKMTDVFGGSTLSRPNGRAAAERLHAALVRFSESRGWPSVAFSDAYDQAWREWYKQHKREFVEKLGKLELAPGPPAYERPSRLPDRSQPGRGERP